LTLKPRQRHDDVVAGDALHRRQQRREAVLGEPCSDLGPETDGARGFVHDHATSGLRDRLEDHRQIERLQRGYIDDLRRSKDLAAKGIHYVDVGTSGGVWGLERGYCLMIGGEPAPVKHLDPLFEALAPGIGSAPRTPGRAAKGSTAEQGYLHCGPSGAGHFVKMVHNGIEYGLMAALAEGLNILHHADAGRHKQEHDAETAPLREPERYHYDFNVGEISELWRRGSVVASWLLDLTASALAEDSGLAKFSGRVSDSGEGRWTIHAAIDEGVPAPVLSMALYQRFSSQGAADYADKLLSAMRAAFGGHQEKA